MSANLWYRKIATKRVQLEVMAPSSFISSMRVVFGEPPWRLDDGAKPTLRGMAAVWNSTDRNPYNELIGAITDNVEIEIWAEH